MRAYADGDPKRYGGLVQEPLHVELFKNITNTDKEVVVPVDRLGPASNEGNKFVSTLSYHRMNGMASSS